MAKLKFTNNEIKVDIEDNIFYIDIFDDVANEGFKEILALADEMKSGNYGSYDDLIAKMIPIFDKILGEGAIKTIFGNEKPKMMHIIQLAYYLTDEINAQREEIFKSIYVKNE